MSQLEAVSLRYGERLSFSFLFLFLSAAPCTDWLGTSSRAMTGLRADRYRRRQPA
jgi:hypothetical protein